MRFVILYRNRDDVRAEIERHIPGFIQQGVLFTNNLFQIQLFSSRPYWPPTQELVALPMNMQCEEVEWDGSKLISIRKLVIDVEVLEKTVVVEKADTST